MAALNTNEVKSLLHRIAHRPGLMAVLGVFPADCLPSREKILHTLQHFTLCCFVVNTDPSTRPGKHWVAFVAFSVRVGCFKLEYFDSYGLPLTLYTDLHASCIRSQFLPLICVVNTISLQDFTSSVCGHYCLLFAHLRAMGRSFIFIIRYLSSYDAVAKARDKFVVRTLHSVLHCSGSTMYGPLNCLTKRYGQQSCCNASK
jgi:hypothetical protein